MTAGRYSHEKERSYYAGNWPQSAKPYLHLEPYLRCWMDPEEAFGGKKVLDIGAGECIYTRLIAERFKPSLIVACDLFTERMLPAARANKPSQVRFAAGDCFRLPFRDGSFDVVFGSFILHQLPELSHVAREIRRVLLPSGAYIGIEPNPLHPVHLARYLLGKHSKNQYLLAPRHVAAALGSGFALTTRFFYARLPRSRNRFLGTCFGITALKRAA